MVAQPTLAVQDPPELVVLGPGLALPVVLDPALAVPVVVDVVIPAVVEVEEGEEEVLAQAPAMASADLLVVVRETLVQSLVHLLLVLLLSHSATPRQAMPL